MDIRKLTDDELAIEAWKQIFKGVPQHLILNYDFFKPMAINNAKFIRQCIKDSTPEGLSVEETSEIILRQQIPHNGSRDWRKHLALRAAQAIHTAQEQKGKDSHV